MQQESIGINNEKAILESLSSRVLHLILYPTEACNFRCVYCYEKYSSGKMKEDIVTGIKKLLSSKMPELDHVMLSWFGGEPLLAQDVIEDISTHIKSLITNQSKTAYLADMTTNGYFLSLPVLKKMIGLGIRYYQITFDGPPDIHNKKRFTADNKETFNRIWDNIERAKSLREDFTILVRLHVDKESYPHIFSFIDRYAKTFGDDKRYELFIRPLSCLGGINDANLPVLNINERDQVMENIFAYMHKNNIEFRSMDSMSSLCYATKLNSFAIRSNGVINKCTVALDEKMNDVGFLRKDGSLMIRRDHLLYWARGIESGNEQELLCPYYAGPCQTK